MQAGQFIRSTSLLDGSFFENTVILLTESNDKGAMGFVLNKEFGRNLNELEEFRKTTPVPLYDGGPVDREHIYFIHRNPDLISGGSRIKDTVCYGGDFRQAIRLIDQGILAIQEIRIFIGYCGWDTNELEEEIAEGSWVMMEDNIFASDTTLTLDELINKISFL